MRFCVFLGAGNMVCVIYGGQKCDFVYFWGRGMARLCYEMGTINLRQFTPIYDIYWYTYANIENIIISGHWQLTLVNLLPPEIPKITFLAARNNTNHTSGPQTATRNNTNPRKSQDVGISGCLCYFWWPEMSRNNTNLRKSHDVGISGAFALFLVARNVIS